MSDERDILVLHAKQATLDIDIAAEIPLQGVTAIFGPSGAGKTSLLRMIAGFDHPDEGRIALGDEAWFDASTRLPAHQRPAATVFQDGRLFPHLNAAGNLGLAERHARPGDGPQRTEVVEALGLSGLLDRRVQTLSGGERQRLALARALICRPRLILLDEPLSALDRKAKREILPFLSEALRRFAIPALYVAHAVDEVAAFADRVLAIEAGRLVAQGGVEEVFERLDLEPLTGRFEAGVVLEAVAGAHDAAYGLTEARIGKQVMQITGAAVSPGAPVRLRIRARDVALSLSRPEGISIRNVLEGRLAAVEAEGEGAYAQAVIDVEGHKLRARLTRAAADALALEPGQTVYALIKTASFEG
jgi:molybdate transport system ATP-binding protein